MSGKRRNALKKKACKTTIQSLPTEILLTIFFSITVKDLINCRAVCSKWLGIINDLARNDDLWARYCTNDFSNVYEIAHEKAIPGLLWYNLYRSLTLWKKVRCARRQLCTFKAASCMEGKIKNFKILSNRVLAVHKKYSIVYYDIDSQCKSEIQTIMGEYSRYTENNHAIVLLDPHGQCLLVRKKDNDKPYEEERATFYRVKLFTLTKTAFYFVNMDDEIFVCSLTDKKLQYLKLKKCKYYVMSIGYSDGELNLLTLQRVIYTIVGTKVVYRCQLGPDSNLLHQLLKYNLLEQLDWRIYLQWMYKLKHAIPVGPLQDMVIIRPYGDVYFVATNQGLLRVYYAPYSDGKFDIFNTNPVLEVRFSINPCPIFQVDAFEVEDGHNVVVATPKMITFLSFTHTFTLMKRKYSRPLSKKRNEIPNNGSANRCF